MKNEVNQENIELRNRFFPAIRVESLPFRRSLIYLPNQYKRFFKPIVSLYMLSDVQNSRCLDNVSYTTECIVRINLQCPHAEVSTTRLKSANQFTLKLLLINLNNSKLPGIIKNMGNTCVSGKSSKPNKFARYDQGK